MKDYTNLMTNTEPLTMDDLKRNIGSVGKIEVYKSNQIDEDKVFLIQKPCLSTDWRFGVVNIPNPKNVVMIVGAPSHTAYIIFFKHDTLWRRIKAFIFGELVNIDVKKRNVYKINNGTFTIFWL